MVMFVVIVWHDESVVLVLSCPLCLQVLHPPGLVTQQEVVQLLSVLFSFPPTRICQMLDGGMLHLSSWAQGSLEDRQRPLWFEYPSFVVVTTDLDPK